MGIQFPESMDDCIYFTRRLLDHDGKIIAWIYHAECEECHKGKMGKPRENGKVKIRAKEYVCDSCGHIESKEEHEPKQQVEIQYTCPFCKHSGEATTQNIRVSYKGVRSYVFSCEQCGEKIGITKKMKQIKEK